MISIRAFLGGCIATSLFVLVQPLAAEVYPLILHGKVTMQDGSPPPKSAGIQRICSDSGSAPGPITNGKGEYQWRMEVDPMRTRVCRLEATMAGYSSSSIDISGLNGYTSTTHELPPLVLSVKNADPKTIISSDSDVPSRSKKDWKAAMAGVDAGNPLEASKQLQAVVQASPKFARGWHTLGIVYENLGMFPEARDSYAHAIEADPKMLPPYATLAHLQVKAKDWQGAAKTADALAKADTKRVYPESYLHLAVARFKLNDLAGAEQSALEAIRPDQKQKAMRAEFVLARILAAKGDAAGAREHITKYLAAEPGAADAETIRAYLQVVGKPEAEGFDPELELP